METKVEEESVGGNIRKKEEGADEFICFNKTLFTPYVSMANSDGQNESENGIR